VIARKEKPKATKCVVIARTAKAVVRIVSRMIERKIADVHGDNQRGFGRGNGTRNAIWMLRIISKRNLETG
jgi:pSer/pThr/pTyr-binding forkhead associated (FHA) protein